MGMIGRPIPTPIKFLKGYKQVAM